MNELFFDIEDSVDSSSLSKPSKGKSLDQIFDVQPRIKSGTALRYIPKSKETKAESPKPQYIQPWKTLFAKISVGYKNGENIGRVGVGIIQNYQNKYRLILYKTKSNVIATFTVESGADYPQIHRQNCYWQFYDDVGVYWSLLFERTAEEVEFINKLMECDINIQLENGINPSGIRHIKKLDSLEPANELNENSEPTFDANSANDQETNSRRPGKEKIPWKGESEKHNDIGNYGDHDDDDDDDDDERADCEQKSSLTLVAESTYPSKSEVRKKYLVPLAHLSTVETTPSATVLNSVDSQVVQLMLVENRTQNTELRMNLDKIDSKIERVLGKLSSMDTHSTEHTDAEFDRLEEQILELKKENRRLKQDLRSRTSISEMRQHGNIGSLYGNELESLGIGVPMAGGIPDIEAIIGKLIDNIQSLKSQVEEKQAQLKFRNFKNQEEKHLNVQLNDELRQVQRKIESLEMEMDREKESETQFIVRLNEFKAQHALLLKDVKSEMTQTLKEIMNSLYHNLAQSIVDMEILVPDKILALIGKTIRQDTLRAVEKIESN